MGPYPYLIYQPERAQMAAELRAADARIGELAAALAQLGSAIARPARSIWRLLPGRQPVVHFPATEPGLRRDGPSCSTMPEHRSQAGECDRSVTITTRALENREHVRRLLETKQPQFAAVLKSVERELSCSIGPGTVA